MGPTLQVGEAAGAAGAAAGAGVCAAGSVEAGAGAGAGVCAPTVSANVSAAPAIDRSITVEFECIDKIPPEKICEVRKTR